MQSWRGSRTKSAQAPVRIVKPCHGNFPQARRSKSAFQLERMLRSNKTDSFTGVTSPIGAVFVSCDYFLSVHTCHAVLIFCRFALNK